MAFNSTDPLVEASTRAAGDLPAADGCLGRTCLKWAPDGKLTAFDLQLVMRKLRLVDHQLVDQEEAHDASATLKNS